MAQLRASLLQQPRLQQQAMRQRAPAFVGPEGRMPAAPQLAMAGSHLGGSRRQQHLRDGVPASPQEVVDAIKEYRTRPSTAKPPPGCAPDAVKLFVGNIPKHCNEAVLNKVFQLYGYVVEIAVVSSYPLPNFLRLCCDHDFSRKRTFFSIDLVGVTLCRGLSNWNSV
jgi:hypothetical protein